MNTGEYEVPLRISDAIFSLIPIGIMVRILLLFRIFRRIGLLQISFTKMGNDVMAWIVIVVTILLGFSIAFSLFTNQVLRHSSDASLQLAGCDQSQWQEMKDGFWSALGFILWIMLSEPSSDDLESCFQFDWFIYLTAYCLLASFSLFVIIVLVNLLIAMMSKTHDSVVKGSGL